MSRQARALLRRLTDSPILRDAAGLLACALLGAACGAVWVLRV